MKDKVVVTKILLVECRSEASVAVNRCRPAAYNTALIAATANTVVLTDRVKI